MSQHYEALAHEREAVLANSEVLPAVAELAFKTDRRIKVTVRAMRGLWVELAEDLYAFHEGRMWRDLGHATFDAWLADPELELERRHVFDLIALWRQLVIERGIPRDRLRELRVSKVREVLPAVRAGHVDIDVALADAGALTRRDLELRYRGLASGTPGTPDVDSTIRTEAEPHRCPTCGTWLSRG